MADKNTPRPWTQGGIFMEGGKPAHVSIYGPRAQPNHQSGPCVAQRVRIEDAPLLLRAANRDHLFGELVGALVAFAGRYEETYCDGDGGFDTPPCMGRAYEMASAVLAKVKDQSHG